MGTRSTVQRSSHHRKQGLHRDRTLPWVAGWAELGWGPRQNQAWSGVAALLTHNHVGLSSELGEHRGWAPGPPARSPHTERGSREACCVGPDQLQFPFTSLPRSPPYHRPQLKRGIFPLVFLCMRRELGEHGETLETGCAPSSSLRHHRVLMLAPEELPSSSSALVPLPTSAWPGLCRAQFSAVPFKVKEGSHPVAWWLRGLLCRPRSPRPAWWASVLLLDPFQHARNFSDLQALCLRAGQVLAVGGAF